MTMQASRCEGCERHISPGEALELKLTAQPGFDHQGAAETLGYYHLSCWAEICTNVYDQLIAAAGATGKGDPIPVLTDEELAKRRRAHTRIDDPWSIDDPSDPTGADQ